MRKVFFTKRLQELRDESKRRDKFSWEEDYDWRTGRDSYVYGQISILEEILEGKKQTP